MIISKLVFTKGSYKKIEEMTPYSHCMVDIMCDYCGEIKSLMILQHTLSIKKYGKYACKNCKWIKYKETCLEKYGFENASSSEKVKCLRKENNLINHGVENVFQSEIIKSQIKKSYMDNHGVEYNSQLQSCKDKIKKNMYGEIWI